MADIKQTQCLPVTRRNRSVCLPVGTYANMSQQGKLKIGFVSDGPNSTNEWTFDYTDHFGVLCTTQCNKLSLSYPEYKVGQNLQTREKLDKDYWDAAEVLQYLGERQLTEVDCTKYGLLKNTGQTIVVPMYKIQRDMEQESINIPAFNMRAMHFGDHDSSQRATKRKADTNTQIYKAHPKRKKAKKIKVKKFSEAVVKVTEKVGTVFTDILKNKAYDVGTDFIRDLKNEIHKYTVARLSDEKSAKKRKNALVLRERRKSWIVYVPMDIRPEGAQPTFYFPIQTQYNQCKFQEHLQHYLDSIVNNQSLSQKKEWLAKGYWICVEELQDE